MELGQIQFCFYFLCVKAAIDVITKKKSPVQWEIKQVFISFMHSHKFVSPMLPGCSLWCICVLNRWVTFGSWVLRTENSSLWDVERNAGTLSGITDSVELTVHFVSVSDTFNRITFTPLCCALLPAIQIVCNWCSSLVVYLVHSRAVCLKHSLDMHSTPRSTQLITSMASHSQHRCCYLLMCTPLSAR